MNASRQSCTANCHSEQEYSQQIANEMPISRMRSKCQMCCNRWTLPKSGLRRRRHNDGHFLPNLGWSGRGSDAESHVGVGARAFSFKRNPHPGFLSIRSQGKEIPLSSSKHFSTADRFDGTHRGRRLALEIVIGSRPGGGDLDLPVWRNVASFHAK